MKSVITATGLDAMNELFNKQPELHVLDIDIHSQEKLWEKLVEKEIKEADILVIIESLSGPFSKQEMIKEVRRQFQGKIFIILEDPDDQLYINLLRDLKITDIYTIDDDPHELVDAVIYDGLEKAAEEVAVAAEKEAGIEKVYIHKKVVAFLGPGGMGKTTMVQNLAAVLAKERYKGCILDLNLEKADIGIISGVEEKGIQGILKEDFDENTILKNVTEKRGVYYFTGLRDLMEIQEVYRKIKGIIKVLRKHYDVVLVDTGNFTSPATHEAICESDDHVFVLNNSERCVKAVKRYMELYNNRLGIRLNAVAFINQFVESDIDKKEIKEILNTEVAGKLKYDRKLHMDIEKGKLIERGLEKNEIMKLKTELFKTKPREGMSFIKRLVKRK